MKTRKRSINQIIEEQFQKWQILQTKKKEDEFKIPVITVSREPGSGGKLIARGIADKLGLDLFHQEVINEMAKNAKVTSRLMETLDEKGLSVLEDLVSSIIGERHLWPDEYSQLLMKVIGTIGKHGRAVLVGRGANFVLPPDKRFRVRIVASHKVRINNVVREHNVSMEDARRHIIRTESDRKAFIRKYYNADISDPLNYDMVLNMDALSIEKAVNSVCAIFNY